MNPIIKFSLNLFYELFMVLLMTSCHKEIQPVSQTLPKKIVYNGYWSVSAADSGVAIEFPHLPNYYSADSILMVSRWYEGIVCASIPVFSGSGGYVTRCDQKREWIPCLKNGTINGQVYFRTSGNSVTLYIKNINTAEYLGRLVTIKILLS